jgi:hypothetical protein
MRRLTSVLLACGVALLNGSPGCMPPCNLPVMFPSVYVRVLNDQTGQGIADAVVTATAGQYSETLSAEDAEGNYVGGYGLADTFSLTVEAPGFASQRIDGIVVESIPFECRVIPANLTVRLTPSN